MVVSTLAGFAIVYSPSCSTTIAQHASSSTFSASQLASRKAKSSYWTWQFHGACEYKDPKDGAYRCDYRHEEEQKGIFDRTGKDGKEICMHFAKLGSCWNVSCPLAHEDIPEAHPTKWCEGLGHNKGINNNIPYINPKFDTKYDLGHVNMAFAFNSVCDPDTCSQAKMGGKYCDLRVGEGLGRSGMVKICKNDPPLENIFFSNLGASHKELTGSEQSNPVLGTNFNRAARYFRRSPFSWPLGYRGAILRAQSNAKAHGSAGGR